MVAAQMAHDIRNILIPVKTNVDILWAAPIVIRKVIQAHVDIECDDLSNVTCESLQLSGWLWKKWFRYMFWQTKEYWGLRFIDWRCHQDPHHTAFILLNLRWKNMDMSYDMEKFKDIIWKILWMWYGRFHEYWRVYWYDSMQVDKFKAKWVMGYKFHECR